MAKLTLTDPSAGYNSTSVIAANNALVEAAFENTVSRDGTAPNQMEAHLDLNSYRVTNVADGVGNQDVCTVAQLNASSTLGIATVSLSTLTDVNTSTPTDKNILIADGVDWESRALTEADISDLGDYAATIGTPVDSQIAVWTGDGTIEGDATFTYDGSQFIINRTPGAHNATPTIALGDGDTGFYESVDDALYVTTSGANRAAFSSDLFLLTNVKVKEAAAASADTAAYGQLWVKNDTPNNLYFTDDSGQDVQITNNGSLGPSAYADNAELTFGTGNDVVIDFDGTNFVIAGTGNFNITGFTDLNFGGLNVITSSHGEMYISGNSTATTVSVADTYYQITAGLTEGVTNQVTFSTDELAVTDAGTYKIDVTMSFTGFANDTYTFGIGINDSVQAKSEIERLTAGADVGALALQGLFLLSASDTITIWGKNQAGTNNFTVTHANVSVTKVG